MSLRQTAKGKAQQEGQRRRNDSDDEDARLPERLPEDPKTARLRRRAEALLWVVFALGLAHWTGFYDSFMAQTSTWGSVR